jgi:hypothetical protein
VFAINSHPFATSLFLSWNDRSCRAYQRIWLISAGTITTPNLLGGHSKNNHIPIVIVGPSVKGEVQHHKEIAPNLFLSSSRKRSTIPAFLS